MAVNIDFILLVKVNQHHLQKSSHGVVATWGRWKTQAGRGAVLASQSKSELVTYGALKPLAKELVAEIVEKLIERLRTFSSEELADKKVYIDRSLYYAPLALNNRASSLSLESNAIGTTHQYTDQKTLRMYVHWQGRSDIDLSGFVITTDSQVQKVGWNASHHAGEYIVYSGDNTGYADKNAEYLDVNTSLIPSSVEWIVVEARIYRGPKNFAGYKGKVHIGWMSREHPEANRHWQPKTLEHAMVLTNKSTVAYLMAYHPKTQNVVYLDMAMGNSQVSSNQDAIRMRIFLESFISLDSGGEEISWNKLNQGHILHLLSTTLVSEQDDADVVFDEKTTAEEVSRFMVN